ncbi:putative transcription factor [Cafeteria roenbergensis virus]|uniref:Putative transcription factor n=1 Tax=Cafeteria roenbergensis virus (strain BV-PW1) TaxID=693272 RepID=E3T4T4_CROVB|nr:putative transcription factor [Cafeteria roenbergensis virus BV-PW1]ADO67197.1 putative transcription factor [Cafeteria roenbergensis virus BV-PW1]
MPRKKKVNIDEIKGFQDEDKSLIVHLPIKVKEDNKLENDLSKLQQENKELKEKLHFLINENLSKVKVIKNTNKSQEGTTSKCWWCDGVCKHSIVLPDKKIKNNFYGNGIFHSFGCALAFNFVIINDEKVWERCSLLYQLRDRIYKNKEQTFTKIEQAPPKEIMKEYGGELSRDEYNNLLVSVDFTYLKLLPTMISSTILIEQRNKNSQDLNQMNLLGLKLKRNKNPVKNKFTLDGILSI